MIIKNKKKFLTISTLILSASIGIITLPTVYSVNKEKYNFSTNDKNEIEKGINNFFNKFNDNLKTFSLEENNKISFSDEILMKIKEGSLNFAQNNNSIEDMKINLKSIVEKNGYSWKDIDNKQLFKKVENDNSVKNLSLSISYNETYGEAMEKINETAKKAAIFGAVASSIAAGYWTAVAFSFGATTASAIAATTQATVLFAESAILGGLYLKYKNNENSQYLNNIPIKSNIYNNYRDYYIPYQKVSEIITLVQIIKGFVPVVKTSIVAVRSIITTTSWAAPSVLALLGILDFTTSVFSLF